MTLMRNGPVWVAATLLGVGEEVRLDSVYTFVPEPDAFAMSL